MWNTSIFSPPKRYSVHKSRVFTTITEKQYNLPPTMNKNKIHSLCCCSKIPTLVSCTLSLPPCICKELKHYIWWTAKIPLHLKCRTPMKQRNVGFLNRSRLKKKRGAGLLQFFTSLRKTFQNTASHYKKEKIILH